MANGNANNYCRLGRCLAPFFSVSSLISYNLKRTSCRRQGALCLGFGFLRLPEGWWFDIEVLTTTGKSIFSG